MLHCNNRDAMLQTTLTAYQLDAKRTWWYVLRHELNHRNIFLLGLVHLLAIWSLLRALILGASIGLIMFTYLMGILTAVGTLAGAHRYFAHRSYRCHWCVKLFLLVCQTISGQGSVIRWAREHRTHHKYTGTDKDCTNMNRGFFFAHIGWLMCVPHPECKQAEAECNVDDLLNDWMIRVQYDYYEPLMILFNAILPSLVPNVWLGENLLDCFLSAFALRYVYTLHMAFCGNSVAHYFGSRPYDRSNSATHCQWIIWATMGGAYHNFHHVFRYDYNGCQYGPSEKYNFNSLLIDALAYVGLVYDRRRAPAKSIEHWKKTYGDPNEPDEPRRSALVDWTVGMIVSALPVWLVLIPNLFRNFVQYNSAIW